MKSENIEDFLYKYSKVNEHLHHDDDGFYLVYPKCYCPIMKNMRKVSASEEGGRE